MIDRMNKPGTILNHSLRVFSALLLITTQTMLGAGGCSPAVVDGNDNPNDVTNTNGGDNTNDDSGNDNAANDNGNDNAANNNGSDGDEPADDAQAALEGYWISARGATDTVWGLAMGGGSETASTITIDEEDGSSWKFNGSWEGGRLVGTCMLMPDFDDFDIHDLAAEPPPCHGDFSADGLTLTLATDEAGASTTWVLERTSGRSPELTASWTDRSTPTSRLISAYDGNELNLIDPADTGPRFDAAWNDAGAFIGDDADGNRWVGVPHDEGQALFVWIEEDGEFVARQFLDRQEEPTTFATPLTGRWMSSWNRGDLTNALRGQASVIFDGADLFVYQRDDNHRVLYTGDYDDGGYWSILATYDGERFQATADSTTAWSGYVDSSGTVIHGHWNEDPLRAFGLIRASTATPTILSGAWSSLYSEYQTPSEPTQETGQAEVSFDGSLLTIRDTYEEADYVIEAEWLGDHFRGEWWSTADPGNRLRWVGELLMDGSLLHGKWELGEWSFSPYALAPRSVVGEAESDTLLVVADPFEEIAATYRDDAAEIAVTLYRAEGVARRFRVVGAEGTVEVTVDERYRPVSIIGPDLTATLTWADDASSLEVVTIEDGVTTTETVALDVSDAALLDMLDGIEANTGLILEHLRSWVQENPGRFAAVVRGEESPPSLSNPLGGPPAGKMRHALRDNDSADIVHRIVTDAATIVSLGVFLAAATGLAIQATTLTMTIAFVGTCWSGGGRRFHHRRVVHLAVPNRLLPLHAGVFLELQCRGRPAQGVLFPGRSLRGPHHAGVPQRRWRIAPDVGYLRHQRVLDWYVTQGPNNLTSAQRNPFKRKRHPGGKLREVRTYSVPVRIGGDARVKALGSRCHRQASGSEEGT